MSSRHEAHEATNNILTEQEAVAEEQRLAARYSNDIEIAKSQRDYELKKSSFDQEVLTKKAVAELAYSLQVIS